MDKSLLYEKWLANTISEEELTLLKKDDGFNLSTTIIQEAKRFKVEEPITIPNFESFKVSHLNNKNKSNTKNSYFLVRIAAVLVICLSLFFLLNNNQKTVIETYVAETTTTLLPDQSQVIMNAASSLQYDSKNWSEDRSVALVGEAFFKVEKGSKFTVETTSGSVEVLGTQFNVNNRGSYFSVSCYEGSVRVKINGDQKILKPGNSIVLSEGKLTEHTTSSTAPTWIKGTSTFKNQTLAQVIEEVERQYNVVINDNKVNNLRRITGSFTHNDLELALASILEPLQLNFNVDAKDIIVLYEQNN